MIFVTGDTHCSEISKLNRKRFPISKNLTKDDYVIVCGDFGLFDDKESEYYVKWWNSKNFTTLFVDGNHENHAFLDSYEVSEFHGAQVHRLASSVYHVMRGEIITLDDKTFFCFGGARSHDISDGILQMTHDWRRRYNKLCRKGKMVRVEGYDWWDRELQSSEERKRALENLAKYDNKVDYIITHDCAYSSLNEVAIDTSHDICVDFLEEIKHLVDFKHWYFGHHHIDYTVNSKETCLYNSVLEVK